ncbi:MAG TPA: BamA/TamA family outer membrane protein [Sphingomonas sp.]|nr:BamA/TamA family outer membrane protein [Sphingomonas sp.]
MRAASAFRWAIVTGAMLAPAVAHAQAIDPHTTPPPLPAAAQDGDQPLVVQPIDPQADTPVIPDAQFDAALPPITGDIEAPLEPMPETGPLLPAAPRRRAPQAAAPASENPPVDAETETELAQPLPPLSTFDTVPLQTVADQQNAEKTPEIRYDVAVNGLNAIGLDDEFDDLSALKDGGGKAENGTMVDARARQDEALAVRLMKSLGYYDATAIATIEQVPNQPGHVRVIVSATPGQLYRLGDIAVKAQPTVPPDLIRKALPLQTGDPIEAAKVQGAEANVSLTLPQNGYPFAKLGLRDIVLDDTTYTGDYTLPVDTGPRSSFGGFQLRGRHPVFSEKHIALLARFKPGELYDVRKTDDLRKALVATGLFSSVSVKPVPTGKPGPDGTELADLQVRQVAGPPRTLAATAGYSTGEGFKVEGSWMHRNLFPPEGALIATATLGSQEQGASATFRRSNAGQRDRTFSIVASADHSNYDAFDAFTGTLGIRWAYDSTPIWQKTLTYAYGADLIGTNESVYDFAAGKRVRRTYGILALPGQVEFDQSDDLLNPTKGYRLKLNLSPETSVHGQVRPYARTMVEATGYYPIRDDLVLAGRVRAGSIFGIDRDDLAPSRRYYGGGGGSVRGYGYQRLGPFDPNGDPVGGRSINEFSIEARYRFGNYGIVPFFDGGNAYASTFPQFDHLHFGAGIGGRLYTNFGPIRIDVATPLNPRKGDGRIALYISIGQAF